MLDLLMSTLLRIIGGIALIIFGFIMARFGCIALMYGLYGGSISSILLGILGIAMLAVGVYIFIKGWNR
jgi:hypothetical protein